MNRSKTHISPTCTLPKVEINCFLSSKEHMLSRVFSMIPLTAKANFRDLSVENSAQHGFLLTDVGTIFWLCTSSVHLIKNIDAKEASYLLMTFG